ncbi:MAG TPA: class I SAM-dependent methyltransferase [Pirellulales bacterium]|jgi:SAM-dependent methyltransferase|nr:class I SAM-dependent methyltransferase [Pirellulales bacterium]
MSVELKNLSPTAPLYTELPYPADGVVRTTNARILLAGLRTHAPHLLSRQRLRIVDLGCGTGENTAGLARMFPEAEIIGVDINRASLDLANRLAARAGATLRFVQCDIESNLVEALHDVSPGPFDVVFSMGVLHHLAEPQSGFRAARRIIQADGRLFCFLYSRLGRREDLAVKVLLDEILPSGTPLKSRAEAISLLGIGNRHTLWAGIKGVRNRLKFGPPLAPLELLRVAWNRNRLTHESDSYSNPCEHLYSCGEIRSLLDETGWTFLALASRAGLPTSPEQHTRRKSELELLRQLSQDALYDYFAFHYQSQGYSFFATPRANRDD